VGIDALHNQKENKMQEFVIVTLNPTVSTELPHKVVAVHHHPRIETCDGEQFLKVEGTIVDATYTFEAAVQSVREREGN
jgi:hypothetical protein